MTNSSPSIKSIFLTLCLEIGSVFLMWIVSMCMLLAMFIVMGHITIN